MPNKITWKPAPAPTVQIGSVGDLDMFLISPGKKPWDDDTDVRLFVRFPSEFTRPDGMRIQSEESAKQLAEELLATFARKLTRALNPPKKKPKQAGVKNG